MEWSGCDRWMLVLRDTQRNERPIMLVAGHTPPTNPSQRDSPSAHVNSHLRIYPTTQHASLLHDRRDRKPKLQPTIDSIVMESHM
jgi:hypothetical protein